MMRDGRNPYGARGGYIRDSRMYGGRDRHYHEPEYEMEYDGRRDYNYDYDYAYERPYERDYREYPFEMKGRFGRDYAPMGKELSERDIETWIRRIMDEIDDKDKQYFKMDNVIKKAEAMGIRFDKFTPEEFYVTVLMNFTDFSDTFGTGNPDIYLKMAKKWLCDEDASLKYGAKLAAYYEHIVNGF